MEKTWQVVLLLFSVILVTLALLGAHAQESDCSRPRVSVSGAVVDEADFQEYLKGRYPHRSWESLWQEIRATVLEELRENSPQVDFVEDGSGCDYSFSYTLGLIAAGKDVEVAGVLEGEYTAVFMSSKLVQNNACGFPGSVLGVSVVRDDPDVFRTVERNIDRYGSLETCILEYERTHWVPPRGPVMEFALEKPYVPPKLDEREMDIRVRVRNCRGEPVFDRYHGQVVIFPRRTERGELRPTKGFPQGFVVTENLVLLEITGEEGGSVTYTLKEGLEPGIDLFQAKTCGIDMVRIQDVLPPVPIAGVTLEVEPEEVYIAPGASTALEVRLFQVTPDGAHVPLEGEVVTIEAKGLVDGSLKPQGEVRTDARGRIRLMYQAGVQEEGVEVIARYQPREYPDAVEERTSVALVEEPACWRGTVDITVDRSFRETKKSDPVECGRDESELIVELHAHIRGELLLQPGQPETILSQDFSGTYEMTIKTFHESCVTTCRRKGVRGEVPVRPGSWESSETRVRGTLSNRDFRVSASVVVDRKTGQYRFSCGFRGLVWRGFSEVLSRYHDVCTGETRETSTASLETELEHFEMSSGEIQGVTPGLKVVKGEKVVEYPLSTGTVKYTWDFQRIPCGE
jgi:hypothetical protein